MNTAVIIDAYIGSSDKEELLRECIRSTRSLGNTTILVSHCHIPSDILDMVDYHLFDKDNTFNNNHVYSYTQKDDVEIRININKSHEFPIIRAMRASISLAKSLGHDFFYFTEFDHKYSDSDIQKIKSLETQMLDEEKDFIIFQPIDAIFGDIKGVYYETCFFGAKTDIFLDIFNSYFPTNIEEYNERFAYRFPNCLEHFFYESFSPYRDKTVLTENYVKLYLTDSEINVSSYQNTKCVIISSESDNDYLYIANQNTSPYTFDVYIDNVLKSSFTMRNEFLRGDFAYLPLKTDCEIRIDISNESEKIKTEYLQYSNNNKNEYKQNGVIIFKNGEPSSDMFKVDIEYDTNKITFTANRNIEQTTLISIKELDSNACIFSFEMPPITVGVSYWAIPLPVNLLSFKNDLNFGGILLEYFQDTKLVESKKIRIKDVYVETPKINLTNTKSVYPNYKRLFIQKIYDQLDMDSLNVVIDSSAGIGLWSEYILRRNTKKLYCFESSEQNLKDLFENTKDYHNVYVISKKFEISDFKSNQTSQIDLIRFYVSEVELDEFIKLEVKDFDKVGSLLVEYPELNDSSKQVIVEKITSFGYIVDEFDSRTFLFAYRQRKNYLIPPATHQNYSQKNLTFSRVNLHESSKNFNWSEFNLGKYYTFDQMYDELYRSFEDSSTGCIYERHGCIVEKDDIVVDIGANIGMFSNVAFERGASKIFAFEPTDTAYICLLQNKPKNCETFKMAISDRLDLVKISSPRELDPIGASICTDYNNSKVFNHVYSTTLDYLFESGLFHRIDFLKIDAEGSELSILNGISDENLTKIRKISMEFHLNEIGENGSKLVWDRLTKSGFKGSSLVIGDGELRMYSFWREDV